MRTNKLYRAKDGILLGVCLGFARWSHLPVVLVRIVYIAFALMTGFFPAVGLYILAALLMEQEPRYRDSWRDREREREDEFYDRLRRSGY